MPNAPASTADGPSSKMRAAYEALTEQLVLLDIPPGAPLPEHELMERLHVGRTPLREAFKRLESDHLVISYPRRGTFATAVDITALSEVSEIRRALEPLAARRAAERLAGPHPAGPARLRLEQLHEELAAVGPEVPARDLMAWDLAVHAALREAAGNTHLATALERYGNLSTRIWSVAAPRMPEVSRHIIEHRDLLRAVLDGDAEGAERRMLAHMADFEASIRQVL